MTTGSEAAGATVGEGGAGGGGDGGEVGVTPLELFFDLVFVFAITQVTWLVSHDHDARGLLHGVLVFAALWWAWGSYAWLTNTVPTGERTPRLVVLGGMAAALVAALAVPGTFGDAGVAFGLAYLVVMVLHLALYVLAGENPEATRGAILRLAPTNLGAAALLVVAGGLDGTAQLALWVLAVALSYAGPYITGVAGFTVHPGHFAERHGLIVIVALGESIIAIGADRGDLAVDWALAGCALLAIALVTGLWWAYFDHDAERAERALSAATGVDRARLARDTYSYLHMPLVFGVVLAAAGIHEVLAHPGDALDPVVGGALAAGVALYFGGLAAVRGRCGGARSVATYLSVVALAVATGFATPHVPAAAALAALAAGALGGAAIDGRRPPSPAAAG